MSDAKNFWVVVEHWKRDVRPVTRELAARARELADAAGGRVSALVLSEDGPAICAKLGGLGMDEAFSISSPELARYRARPYAEAAAAIIRKHSPTAVLIGATTDGREFAGSLAATLQTGIASDCTELDWTDGDLVARRPVYGGRLLETVRWTGDGPRIASIRPRAYDDPGSSEGEPPAITEEEASIPTESLDVEILEFKKADGESVNLADADAIVAGGRGLQAAENFEVLRELATEIGAALGASRAVVDDGWIAYPHQVGQTGKTVRPKLYIAVGISGAIQHLAGMKTSETIFAINKDANAPIFKIANFGFVGDALEIVPLLTKKIREREELALLPEERRNVTNGAVRTRGFLSGLGGSRALPLALTALLSCAPEPEAPPRSELAGAEVAEAAPEDGEGVVQIDPRDPVIAGSWGSWSVQWTAGASGVPPGGGVVLQVSPFWGWSPPQVRRADSPGYTTVSCSAADVALDVSEGLVPMTIVARVEKGSLGAGETVTFVYGDSTAAGPGGLAHADLYAEESEAFLIKTDGNGDGFFVPVADQPTLRIVPQSPAFLSVAAPAVVSPGASFDVSLRALDRQGNLAPLAPGDVTLVLLSLAVSPGSDAGEPDTLVAHERTPGGGWGGSVHIDQPGLYRLVGGWRNEETALSGINDLLLVEEGSPFETILWGDIHCHSGLSDGTGLPADLLTYARDVAGLDVAAITDHDAHGLFPLSEGGRWERVKRAVRDTYEPGRFVTLLGYEWTSWDFGHRNVYYPGTEGEVFEFRAPESDTPEELWDCIAPFGGITIPHHPGGGPVPIDWSVPSRAEREGVVEICSIHGSSEAPGVERGIYRPVAGASVRDALRLGHRLGFLASGDTHDGHPGRRSLGAPTNGLAAFRASARTREAVWEALRERRVYGTSGPRILVSTDWGGVLPGSELARVPAGPLRVRVVAPEPIEVIEIIGAGGTIESAYGGGRMVTRRFLEGTQTPASSWLYVRVVLADGEVAWDSPYWLPEAQS